MTAPNTGVVEGFSQIAAAGAGTRVRTLQFQVLQPDDTRVEVDMQVVVLADVDGKALGTQFSPLYVDSARICGAIGELQEEVRKLRAVMERYTESSED
jgi:hypothetical protein